MTDIIQNEIDNLVLAEKLGVTPDLLIIPQYSKNVTKDVTTLFEKTKGKILNDIYSELTDWKHINGTKIKPIEIVTAWGANNSTSKSLLEEMRKLYKQSYDFIWDILHLPLDEESFMSKVKDLRGFLSNKTDKLRRLGQDKQIQLLYKFNDWMKSMVPITSFDFIVDERILTLPHNFDAGYDLTVFDMIESSDYLPFIVANLNSIKTEKKGVRISTDRRYKLQNNPSREMKFPLEWINTTNIPETIQMKIFVREDTPELYNNKSSYSTVEYLFNTNEFLLHYPIEKSQPTSEVINRFTSQLNKIKFYQPVEYQITGSFVIRNFSIDDHILLHLIMNNDVLRQFIYVDESQNTFAQKKRLTLHLIIGQEHLSITLSSKKAKQSESFFSKGQLTRLRPNESYLHIQINRAPNENFAQWTALLIRNLLYYYYKYHQDIIKLYKNVIPEFKGNIIKLSKKSDENKSDEIKPEVVTDSSMTKLKRLKLADPDAFVTYYATKCQAPSQPLVIPESEVEYWRKKGRQVVKYPSYITNPDADQFTYRIQNYYVSDNEEAKYLGFMKNTLSNSKNYPYLICAYKEEHLKINPENWNITIIKLGDEVQSESKKTNLDYILDANKILDENRRGYIRSKITSFLDNPNLIRLGMPHSPSSLLHCILMALKSYRTKYQNLSSDKKEDFISSLKHDIVKQIPVLITKQEAYDMSLDTIQSKFLSDEEFIDPAIYYRLLEEFFNINIFTFITTDEPTLEVPRHKFFHLRSYQSNDKPVVLIYKHFPTLEYQYPQCELIISTTGQKDKFLFKDPSLLSSLQDLMLYSARVTAITIEQSFTEKTFYENPRIDSLFNVSSFSFLKSSLWKLVGQYIDGAGKVRALHFRLSNSSDIISIYTPFLPVFNLPILSIQTSSEKLAKQFTTDNQLLYQNQGFTFNNIFYRFELYPPLSSQISSLQLLTHTANLMKDIIQILYSLYPYSRSSFNSLFLVDSSVKYDVSLLPRHLPNFSSFDEAFDYFSVKSPSMFRQKYFLVSSEKHLSGVLHFISLLSKSPVPSVLPRFYSSPSDFIRHHPYEMIFVDQSTFALSLLQMHSENLIIHDSLFYSTDPYILRHRSQLFIVQHVQDLSRDRSVALIYHWYRNLINFGFNVSPLSFDYAVHEIDYSSSIDIPDKSICRFQNGFCALLPLDIQIIHDL